MADLHVLDLRMDREGEVRRQGPRGGRPDDDRQRMRRGKALRGGLRDREGDPDGGRALILVLDLGLGPERGLAGDRPIDGLLGTVDQPLVDETGEATEDLGLVGRIHRAVFRSPVGEDPEALELATLFLDVGGGELGARLADAERVQGLLLGLQLLHDLVLDRQAVAVPTGDVGRAEAAHRLVAQDGILQQFVEGGADVHVPVGEGRTIVEHEGRLTGGAGLDRLVEAEALPMGDAYRLALGETGPHREIGHRKVEGILELFGHGRVWAGSRGASGPSGRRK